MYVYLKGRNGRTLEQERVRPLVMIGRAPKMIQRVYSGRWAGPGLPLALGKPRGYSGAWTRMVTGNKLTVQDIGFHAVSSSRSAHVGIQA